MVCRKAHYRERLRVAVQSPNMGLIQILQLCPRFCHELNPNSGLREAQSEASLETGSCIHICRFQLTPKPYKSLAGSLVLVMKKQERAPRRRQLPAETAGLGAEK